MVEEARSGIQFDSSHWALILGGSSGFGLATAHKLAKHGMNIAVVHRDRRGSMKNINPEFDKIRETGIEFISFNVDALADAGRAKVLDALSERMGSGRVRLMMHSIAFGNLKLVAPISPTAAQASETTRTRLAEQLGISVEKLTEAVATVFAETDDSDALAHLAEPPAFNSNLLLEDEDYARTVHSMGTSMSTWTQDIFKRELFAKDARILGMTSEGNEIAWRGYAAVAAAKVAMESVSRSIAVEFAPYGIRSNIVQAGVTPTRALALIPGSAQLKAGARLRNPFGRLTTPEDVADVICLLCTDEARWINGTIVRADGGEHIGG